MKVVVAGATGFVGRLLIRRLLEEDHRVVVLTRTSTAFKNNPNPLLKVEPWDGQNAGYWSRQMADADAVVNLSGEGIADGKWTVERKRLLKASRIDSTRALANQVARCMTRPKVFVNASAVGFYGPSPEGEVAEDRPKGKGFLADTCADWENEARRVEPLGVRLVLLRFGVVIDQGGGALEKFTLPFRFFAGGPLGSGRQPFPWVHRQDAVGAILFALKNEALSGPVNVVAPETLTMGEFCRALGKAMKRPSWAPVPAFILKAMFGEMSEMLLTGQKAVPTKLLQAGYSFLYPHADQALLELFK